MYKAFTPSAAKCSVAPMPLWAEAFSSTTTISSSRATVVNSDQADKGPRVRGVGALRQHVQPAASDPVADAAEDGDARRARLGTTILILSLAPL